MAAPKRALWRVEAERQQEIEHLLAVFERELAALVARAVASTSSRYAFSLRETSPNLRVELLSNLPRVWEQAIREAGIDALTESFVEEFNGQIPPFQRILDLLSERLNSKIPQIRWTDQDLESFASRQVATARQIHSVVSAAGSTAMRKALFNVGGISPAELALVVADQSTLSIGQARTVADTAISSFYRSVQEAGYSHIEEELVPGALKYEYFGPEDKLTRPFCKILITPLPITRKRRTFTMEEIESMDNGQTEDVFVTGGGWNCRHSWLIGEISDPRTGTGNVPSGLRRGGKSKAVPEL